MIARHPPRVAEIHPHWSYGTRQGIERPGIATWSWCHARESLPRHTDRPQRLCSFPDGWVRPLRPAQVWMDVTSGQHCDGPRTDTTTGRERNGQSSDQVTGVGRTSAGHPPQAGQVRWMTPARGQWIDESQPGARRPAPTLPASPRPATRTDVDDHDAREEQPCSTPDFRSVALTP